MRFLVLALLVCGVFAGTAGSASADFYTGLTFPTNVGTNTLGPAIVITFNADGSITTTNPHGYGPYDGSEDTYIGVVNNSGFTITSIPLSSTLDIFGFDGDGIQASPYNVAAPGDGPVTGIAGNPLVGLVSGYEGPGTSFTISNLANTAGSVNFIQGGGLPSGEQAYFSLEEAISINQLTVGNSAAPEPTSLVLAGIGGGCLLLARRLRRRNVAVVA